MLLQLWYIWCSGGLSQESGIIIIIEDVLKSYCIEDVLKSYWSIADSLPHGDVLKSCCSIADLLQHGDVLEPYWCFVGEYATLIGTVLLVGVHQWVLLFYADLY